MAKKRKFFTALGMMLAVIGVVGIFVSLQFAHAGALGDIWKSLTEPFTVSSSVVAPQGTAGSTPVPLYQPAIDYEKAVVAAVKRASPAVVSITISKNVPIIENCPYNPFGDLPPEFRRFFGDDFQFSVPCEKGRSEIQEVGGGSGFIVSEDGLIVTNKHVVLDEDASYTVFTNDGKKYDAKVLARDPVQDLAIIKVNGSNFPVVTLGSSEEVELGQTAIAIGNALGEFRNTVSVGVVSGLARTITASGGGGFSEHLEGLIQTDAAINPGNSGGPLLNLRGEVIGINTAIVSGAQSVGFAIPIERAKRDIQSVKKTGEITAPFLGVRYVTVTPELAEKQNLPVDYGAVVRGNDDGPAVEPNSPAARAGILAEDIILEVNGKHIDKDHTLASMISQFNVGDTINLTVRRGNQTLTLRVALAKRPKL